MATNTNTQQVQLFVVSTSHMDWDWNQTFDEYYETNSGSTPVKTILANAIALLQNVTLPVPYQFNLAEVAWLQRYLKDNKDQLTVLQGFTPNQFMFLGGGITSPDNLVCNGEAFIRNYLVGRTFLKAVKLTASLTDVCWIPDDFGQDPQLPVVLNAMGMTGVSFWRVPGNEPIIQNGNPPQPQYNPLNGSTSISNQLIEKGVTFFWKAADGSTILTQQMSQGYGVIWNQTGDSNAITLRDFTLSSGLQPGNIMMAPCGGDFSNPSGSLANAVADYNSTYAPGNNIYAGMLTFQDFINAMNTYAQANPNALQTIEMDASYFWTGYFASRPQLKINQQQTVNNLMATETLSTLLCVQYPIISNIVATLTSMLAEAWEKLCPSTHHDYVTGTSPDRVYRDEQLKLGNEALNLSQQVLKQALSILGGAVQTHPNGNQVPYIVFNPSGFKRTQTGNFVEIPASPDLDGMNSVWINEGRELVPIQRTSSNTIVFPCYISNGMPSMTYTAVYFTTELSSVANPLPQQGQASYKLSNKAVSITVDAVNSWAISSLIDEGNNGFEVLKVNGLGNQLRLYYETDYNNKSYQYGNIYQMGDEMEPGATDGSGFYTDGQSFFTAVQSNGSYEVSVLDNGPYIWRLSANIANTYTNATAQIEYLMYAEEPLVRIQVTGNAASSLDNSIVATWAISDEQDRVPSGIMYGTGNHWNDGATSNLNNPYAPTPYWNGPLFRPVHDYLTLQPATNTTGTPMAAMYNEAMRAWAYYNGLLLGTLFRNAPGQQRGAHGTDTGTYTQRYAFRVPGRSGIAGPESCQPLQESISFQQPLLAVAAIPMADIQPALPETGTLAAPQQTNSLIRVARTQLPGTEPLTFVMRIYQPTNNVSQNWQFNLPMATAPALALVTALEEPLAEQPAQQPSYNNGAVTIYDMPTLTTLWVQV